MPKLPHHRDALVIGLVTLAMFAVAAWLDLFEALGEFVEDHEAWEIDEIAVATLFACVGLIVFGYRRLRELSEQVRARSAAEAEANKLARHDPLTGLANRRCFAERLEYELSRADQTARVAVLIMDLDGFKQINDIHGHATGDEVLIEAAARIASATKDEALLARVGGDEFAIVMPHIKSLEDPTRLARRIVASFVDPFLIGSIGATLSCGIGIAVAPDNGTDPDEIVRRADRALYRAKAEGASSIRHFESNMDAHLERRLLVEREMRDAIAEKAIVPHYQPIVSLDGQRITGFEALARWTHPKLGPIVPNVFIPIAEESGQIGALSDLLLRQACADAQQWPRNLTLSFNISPVQLRDSGLGLRILAALGESGLDPHRLELEITESALVDHAGIAQTVIDQLREVGVRIALDDFGTGYATLSQLLALHVDKLKIDHSFVDRLGKDNESNVIVRAIIGLAKGFGLTTTAEGIEDQDQLDYLKANGCTDGQGFLFSKAVPAGEVSALLKVAATRDVA